MDATEKPLAERIWRGFRLSLYLSARPFVLAAFRVLIGFRIEGLENVPRKSGALVISNHLHNSDPILLVAAYPRPLLWMAKKEVFGVPFIGWVADSAGAFPVDRGSADRAALRNAERLLREDFLVGVFPEGTRSTSGGLKDVYPGVALIAVKSGVPILPTAIFGSETLPFNGRKGRRRRKGRLRVTVRIGEPFHLPAKTDDGRRRDMSELTDIMMIQIARLLPEEYRGIYAERARSSADLDRKALERV
ncbi:MAG TPA: lysophospholipid acyltransferase family protein [Nitrolancea sp.]|nr:lysophospholipid acyltransferase family protein [Nitrolancea sp.]